MSTHGLRLTQGYSVKQLRKIPLLGLPLKVREPRTYRAQACSNYVLVFPLSPTVYPQGQVAFGQVRADRGCIILGSAALQFIDAARSVGCPWFIETVQNEKMRYEADRAVSSEDEQTWRSVSVEMWHIWAVLDPAQMKLFSALYRAQLNTVDAPDGDVTEGEQVADGNSRRAKSRRRNNASPAPLSSDPGDWCVSAQAIRSVHRQIEAWHLLFGNDRSIVPNARDVQYDLVETRVPDTHEESGGEPPTAFGGLDISTAMEDDEEDQDDSATITSVGSQAGAVSDSHERGTLLLPRSHILYPLQADVLFGSRAHRRQLEAGCVLHRQRDLSNYFQGEGHLLELVFSEALGGPVRSSTEFHWLPSIDVLTQFGLPDRVEPTFPALAAHLARAAYTSNMPIDALPSSYDELLDKLEDGMCDPTEAGNPWVVSTKLGVGAGEVAGDYWAPNVDILTDDIYAGAYSAKAAIARVMSMIDALPGDATDTVDVALNMAASAWTKVFNTPGDTVPPVFEHVFRNTTELAENLRAPRSKAAKYAQRLLYSSIVDRITRLSPLLPPGTDMNTVTLSCMDTIMLWSMFKISKLSNQQTAINVVIRRLQGAIPVIDTTGANMLVTLFGTFGAGKSKAVEVASSALFDCCILAITAYSAQGNLDTVVHMMKVIDDAAQSTGHNSINMSLMTAGVAKAKRNVKNEDAEAGYATAEQLGVMKSVLSVTNNNFDTEDGSKSRTTAAFYVSKEGASTAGGTIGELASAPGTSAGSLGASLVMKLQTGFMFQFWSANFLMGHIDDTMFHVAIAVTRACYASHGKTLDAVLDARAIGHTRKTAEGILGTRVGWHLALFDRDRTGVDCFKSYLAKGIMGGSDAMMAVTMQIVQRSAGIDAMCRRVGGALKQLVYMEPSKLAFHVDDEDSNYVKLTVTGRNMDAVLKALAKLIPEHPVASISPALKAICGHRGNESSGVDVMRTCANDPSRWTLHRASRYGIFCVEAMSPIEVRIWKAMAVWYEGAKRSGMTMGLVKYSWDGERIVFTPKALDMLRRPHMHPDAPSVLQGLSEDVLLPTLTRMNQCDFSTGSGSGLKLSSTRDGPIVNLTEEVSAFVNMEVDDRCVECGPGSIEYRLLKPTTALWKKKKTLDGCASINIEDFAAVLNIIEERVVLPAPLRDAWQITLRAEGAVRDGSTVATMTDPHNTAAGTVFLKTDYDAVTVDSVTTPGFCVDDASAFEPESELMPNTVLPNRPTIDTSIGAQYARKSIAMRQRRYNLSDQHFCPVHVRDVQVYATG